MFGKDKGKLPGPKEIPELAGRYMVVNMKQDPDYVWKLKGVTRPAEKKHTFYCRVFSEAEVNKAKIKISDWTSLDGHPELILWEGYIEKDNNSAIDKKFAET